MSLRKILASEGILVAKPSTRLAKIEVPTKPPSPVIADSKRGAALGSRRDRNIGSYIEEADCYTWDMSEIAALVGGNWGLATWSRLDDEDGGAAGQVHFMMDTDQFKGVDRRTPFPLNTPVSKVETELMKAIDALFNQRPLPAGWSAA